jgi:two-component system, LuxR family, response regulator FixJ
MPESAHARSLRPLLVLVEDDSAVLSALTFSFETEGYQVAAFRDPASALAAPETGRAACLVVDQHLPGLTGLQVVARLRGQGVAAPALIITTHPTAQLRRDAAAAHIEIVEKPLLGDVLAAKVRALSHVADGGHGQVRAPTNPD